MRKAILAVLFWLVWPTAVYSQVTSEPHVPGLETRSFGNYCWTPFGITYPDESREICAGNCGGKENTPAVTTPPEYYQADGKVVPEMRGDANLMFNRKVQGIACGQARSDSISLKEIADYDLAEEYNSWATCPPVTKAHEKYHDWNADITVGPANFIPFTQELAEHWAGRLDAEHYKESELSDIYDTAGGPLRGLDENLRQTVTDQQAVEARKKIFFESGVLGKLLPRRIQDELKADFIRFIQDRKEKGYVSLYDNFKIDGKQLMNLPPPPKKPAVWPSVAAKDDYDQQMVVWITQNRLILDKMGLFPNESTRGQIKFIVCGDREYQAINPSEYETMKMGLAADMIFRTLQPKQISDAFYARIPDLSQPVNVLRREYLTSLPDRELDKIAKSEQVAPPSTQVLPPKTNFWQALINKIAAYAQSVPLLGGLIKPMWPQWPPAGRDMGDPHKPFNRLTIPWNLDPPLCFNTPSCKGKEFKNVQYSPSHTVNHPKAFPSGNQDHDLFGVINDGGDNPDYVRLGFFKEYWKQDKWVYTNNIPDECSYGDKTHPPAQCVINKGCGWPKDACGKDNYCRSYFCSHENQRNVDVYNNVPYLWSAWWQTAGDCMGECMTKTGDAASCKSSCDAMWGKTSYSSDVTYMPSGFLNLFKPANVFGAVKSQSQPSDLAGGSGTTSTGLGTKTMTSREIADVFNKSKNKSLPASSLALPSNLPILNANCEAKKNELKSDLWYKREDCTVWDENIPQCCYDGSNPGGVVEACKAAGGDYSYCTPEQCGASCPPGTSATECFDAISTLCGRFTRLFASKGGIVGFKETLETVSYFGGDPNKVTVGQIEQLWKLGGNMAPEKPPKEINPNRGQLMSRKRDEYFGCSYDKDVVFDINTTNNYSAFSPIPAASKVTYGFVSKIPSSANPNDRINVTMTSPPQRKLLFYRLGGTCNANEWFSAKVLMPAYYVNTGVKDNLGKDWGPLPPNVATMENERTWEQKNALIQAGDGVWFNNQAVIFGEHGEITKEERQKYIDKLPGYDCWNFGDECPCGYSRNWGETSGYATCHITGTGIEGKIDDSGMP